MNQRVNLRLPVKVAAKRGDLAKPDSPVRALRQDPRHYALMEELNSRPRTTYLADLRAPNPDLGGRT